MNRDQRHRALYGDVDDAMEAIARVFGPGSIYGVSDRPLVVRWEWRTVPFGRCIRCLWPANTLGPDAQPWHAFCWGNPDPVPSFSEWMRRKVDAGEWGNR